MVQPLLTHTDSPVYRPIRWPFEINRDHPLAKYASCLYYPAQNGQAYMINAVGAKWGFPKVVWPSVGAVSKEVTTTQFGQFTTSDQVGTAYDIRADANTTREWGRLPFTILTRFRVEGVAGGAKYIFAAQAGSRTRIYIAQSGKFVLHLVVRYNNTGGTIVYDINPNMATGEIITIVARASWTAQEFFVWRDGAYEGTASAATDFTSLEPTYFNDFQDLSVCGNADTAVNFNYKFDEWLPLEQAAQLANNPTEILQPYAAKVYAFPTAVGGPTHFPPIDYYYRMLLAGGR